MTRRRTPWQWQQLAVAKAIRETRASTAWFVVEQLRAIVRRAKSGDDNLAAVTDSLEELDSWLVDQYTQEE